MTSTRSLPAEADAHKTETERCIHCFGGFVFEPTDDSLVDEAHECHICFGTTIKTDRAERLRIKAERRAR